MGWFETVKNPKLKSNKKITSNTPNGEWQKCHQCGDIVQTDRLVSLFQVCPYCDFHFRLPASERLKLLFDEEGLQEFHQEMISLDPLEFHDKSSYKKRLQSSKEKTGRHDGTYLGLAKIFGQEVSFAVMDFSFMGGSMGVVTGEKITLCFEQALERRIPAIVVSASGGARMQEGILSLMQMAKTSSVRQKLRAEGIPYISILTDPTTGGVAASYSMLGDINLTEPNALIGFAGPRVIEQSIRQKLPDGFQKSDFLLEHGLVDRIVHRHSLKEELSFFIRMFLDILPIDKSRGFLGFSNDS